MFTLEKLLPARKIYASKYKNSFCSKEKYLLYQ